MNNLKLIALSDDSVVEVQGEREGVHKAVELIASHFRKLLVDRSVIDANIKCPTKPGDGSSPTFGQILNQGYAQSRQNMIQEAPVEMPYRHVVIIESLINDLDKDTVLMLDMFQLMQENMSAATDICKKIVEDHRRP
ncbi:unnamed protein product [Lactuca virosa]|uniref:K Homology domain-containing protein n=1 Tax=Lactuca virosa TaxID=75947 RepID=A0AAU9NKY5_9ASTR|nr:unnamed protein product [Lactuca virosa]